MNGTTQQWVSTGCPILHRHGAFSEDTTCATLRYCAPWKLWTRHARGIPNFLSTHPCTVTAKDKRRMLILFIHVLQSLKSRPTRTYRLPNMFANASGLPTRYVFPSENSLSLLVGYGISQRSSKIKSKRRASTICLRSRSSCDHC